MEGPAMARVEINAITSHFKGQLGDLRFRDYLGRTWRGLAAGRVPGVTSSRPTMTNRDDLGLLTPARWQPAS
jgi:hypothetical protein